MGHHPGISDRRPRSEMHYFCPSNRKQTSYMNRTRTEARSVGFDRLESIPQTAYTDGEVAFLTDLKDLVFEPGSMRMDTHLLVTCLRGRLRTEVNARPVDIGPDEILVCQQNALVDNCLISADYEGHVMCLSPQVLADCVPGSERWKRVFCFLDTPVIRAGKEMARRLGLYGEIIREKIQQEQTAFRREIILAIVRAILYEVMECIKADIPVAEGPARQHDTLFRQFIELLAGTTVKPRSVTWYAQRLCVTPKYLSTVCKSATGRTAFDWIHEYVRADVRHALKHSNLSIKEIAEQLKFPNISFFGKYCRHHFGYPPTEYRQKLRS